MPLLFISMATWNPGWILLWISSGISGRSMSIMVTSLSASVISQREMGGTLAAASEEKWEVWPRLLEVNNLSFSSFVAVAQLDYALIFIHKTKLSSISYFMIASLPRILHYVLYVSRLVLVGVLKFRIPYKISGPFLKFFVLHHHCMYGKD